MVLRQSSSYPQVIVAGMPRTGTDSIKRALEILYGDGARAYHMTEVLNRPNETLGNLVRFSIWWSSS